MALKDFRLKFKGIRLRRFFLGDGKRKRRVSEIKKNRLWIKPVSHGCYSFDQSSSPGRDSCYMDDNNNGCLDSDSVLVQRDQSDDVELWFFDVSDDQLGKGIAKYMQAHLFNKLPNACEIRRKGKETLQKAYIAAKCKIREDDKQKMSGSASAMVINGEKIVMANLGDYRAVVCIYGNAHQIRNKRQKTPKTHWSHLLFPGCNYGDLEETDNLNSSELAVGAVNINPDTEFVILASSGIWEVMKNQEAVNLIRHIEDPQEAAKCLAREALMRRSKSHISCIVIRFD